MSSIEALKEQARTHEQKEEWVKALGLYKQAIEKLAAEGAPDIGLYNRVGDLMVRQGQIEPAVENYEKAIDLYMEAELPNNAIAVCKKIVRNMPQRHSVYLRMGQIRGKQGLLADARQNFLTYAERMQAEGNVDEGLRALTELADFSPEDPDIRLAVANQMQGHGRTAEAISQLQTGFSLAAARRLPTDPFEQMLAQLGATPGAAPGVIEAASADASDPGDIPLAPAPAAESEDAREGGLEMEGFEIALSAAEAPESEGEGERPADAAEEGIPTFDFAAVEEEREEEEAAAPLPMLGEEEEAEAALPILAEPEEAEEEGEPLPILSFDDGPASSAPVFDAAAFGESDKEDREGLGEELPALDAGGFQLETPAAESGERREEATEEARPSRPVATPPPQRSADAAPLAPLPPRPAPAGGAQRDVSSTDPMGHEMLAARGDLAGAIASLRKLTRLHPEDAALAQRLVDYAAQLGDRDELVGAQVDLGEAFRRSGQAARATAAFEAALALDGGNERALTALGRTPKPEAKSATADGFIDLGAMLFDEEDEAKKTTRFVVAYEEPSGDEHADFAKMLSQFKAKVAQNLSADDVKAHQDLGTAYKEMGLIDEAIAEFQQALRASANHLPSLELLGQCFLEKGQPEAAVRTLKRALEAPFDVEDELLGIYYYLGRAFERVGNTKEALEFYDRVFTLDINFADVTERLRALR